MSVDEFLDRLAEKAARIRGVESVVANDVRMVVRFSNGRSVTFTVEGA